MKVGLVSDAHGNPAGLDACLRALAGQGAARIYFLGDAVGYLPEVTGVLELLRSSGAICIRGNHEAMLLGELAVPEGRGPVYRLSDAAAQLEAADLAWIRSWPTRLEVDLAGARLLMVHGSPADPLRAYVYPDTDLDPFRTLPCDALFLGHTHRPFVSQAGRVSVVNVGSSGMPRDVGHLASCAIYDTGSRSAEILRVRFDASALIANWGDRIHPAAAACLRRSATSPVVGTMVAA